MACTRGQMGSRARMWAPGPLPAPLETSLRQWSDGQMTTKRVKPVGVYIELDRGNWERLAALAKRAHTTPVMMARALMLRWLASAERSGMVRTGAKREGRPTRRQAH